MARKPKTPKPKKVAFELIPNPDEFGDVPEPHVILRDLVRKHHDHLAEARFALAWRQGWRANADGQLILGQCRKASDLDRTLHDFDFVILLNHDVWVRPEFDRRKREALIHHELLHAEVSRTEEGEVKYDAKGRVCYRIRKHDIEEFRSVIDIYGLYKADLVAFAESILAAVPGAGMQPGLFDAAATPAGSADEPKE